MYEEYTTTANGTIGASDFVTSASSITFNDRISASDTQDSMRWTVNPAYNAIYPDYVTTKKLERFFRKIYKVIEEHTKIDISEDEFLNILQEDE